MWGEEVEGLGDGEVEEVRRGIRERRAWIWRSWVVLG